MTMIAAVLLFVLTQIPTVITCTSNIYSLSFSGTSVIIVVGVVLETAMAIKSELLTRQYMKKGKKEFFGIKLNQSI
jgi:preprotein translocase subunit SecY